MPNSSREMPFGTWHARVLSGMPTRLSGDFSPDGSANFANFESWHRPKSPTKMALAKRRVRVNTSARTPLRVASLRSWCA